MRMVNNNDLLTTNNNIVRKVGRKERIGGGKHRTL